MRETQECSEVRGLPRDSKSDVAESMLGIPYVDLGRDEDGIDCLGMVLMFYKRMGIHHLPDPLTQDPDTLRFSPLAESPSTPRRSVAPLW